MENNDHSLSLDKHTRRVKRIDKIVTYGFLATAAIALSIIFIITIYMLIKGIQPFIGTYEQGNVNVFNFIFGMSWLDGRLGLSPNYGIGFAIINTIFIALAATAIAIPIGSLIGLFIVRTAPPKISLLLVIAISILAAVPSVIYGSFGMAAISPMVDTIAGVFGIKTTNGNMLTTIIILAIMILPTITVLAEISIRAVDKKLIQGSLALGASEGQTNFKVILRAAKSGIFAGAIIGIARALGEATAVSMVSGNKLSGIGLNPFDRTMTMTSAMLRALKETTGLDFDVRFSVGLVLMIIIFTTSIILNKVKERLN